MPPLLFLLTPLIPLALLAGLCAFGLTSCSESDPYQGPVIETPANGKVDLTKVSMKVTKAKIKCIDENHYQLDFDYTLINKAGATLSFQSIFSGKDDLIEVNLSDQNGDRLFLGKRPQEGLTLAQARAMLIPKGKSTRHYTVPVMPELRMKDDPITVRVRLHAPSRYDELRSTVEAPLIQAPWPQSPEIKPAPSEQSPPTRSKTKSDPQDYPLTYPVQDATPLPQR